MQENENISTYPEEPTNPNDYEGFEKSVYYIFNLLRLMYYSKVESEDKFYSKIGGVIGGNVTIQGNLVVNGVNYAIDTTHLNVGDYTITLAKDNEQTLTSMVGMVVPKYDGTNYGFFGWDADGYAYVGDLTNYDGTSNITLANNSSLQKISTIDTTNTVVASNGVIYVYDATSHCFKKPTVDNKYYVIRNGEFVESELFTEQKSKNISNALYNLGAFDTISGNTITRQTGYAYGKDYMDKTILRNSANNPYINTYISVNALDKFVGNCPKVDSNSWWSATFTTPTLTYDSNGNTLIVMLPNGATDTSALQDIQIQYKLATSYQDNIIPNQPLLNLDSNGCNFLREEWEKGLNLFNINNNVVGNTNQTYSISGNIITITSTSGDNCYSSFKGNPFEPNKTYTVSWGAISNSGNAILQIGIYDGEDIVLPQQVSSNGSITFTTRASATTLNVAFYTKWIGHLGGYGTSTIENVMLVEKTTKYPYQAYNGAIVHKVDIEPVLLWENSSPNSAFASGNITLSQDRTNFKSLTIWCKLYKDVGYGSYAITIDTINSYYHLTLAYGNSNGNQLNCRGMQPTSNTVLSFADNYNGGQVDNNRLIPIRIFGNKI